MKDKGKTEAEKNNHKRKEGVRKTKLGEDRKAYPEVSEVLGLLAGGAFLSLVILVPVIPIALRPFLGPWEEFDFSELRRHLKRFKKDGLVEIENEEVGGAVRLTQRGRERVAIEDIRENGIKREKKWDGSWWLVLYDIPNKYKKARDYFSYSLKLAGLLELQESVLIFPFDCSEEVEVLRTNLGISQFVRVIVAEKIEGEDKFRAKFKV